MMRKPLDELRVACGTHCATVEDVAGLLRGYGDLTLEVLANRLDRANRELLRACKSAAMPRKWREVFCWAGPLNMETFDGGHFFTVRRDDGVSVQMLTDGTAFRSDISASVRLTLWTKEQVMDILTMPKQA